MLSATRSCLRRCSWLVAACLFFSGAGALAPAAEPVAQTALPDFRLKDPAGVEHNRAAVLREVVVLLSTIPNVKHGAFQECWVRWLKKHLPAEGARLVVLEDIHQCPKIRDKAERGLQEHYQKGQRTLILMDSAGELRRGLRVPEDETTVLVFDRQGRVLHRVSGLTAPDDIREAAKALAATVRRCLTEDQEKAENSPRTAPRQSL